MQQMVERVLEAAESLTPDEMVEAAWKLLEAAGEPLEEAMPEVLKRCAASLRSIRQVANGEARTFASRIRQLREKDEAGAELTRASGWLMKAQRSLLLVAALAESAGVYTIEEMRKARASEDNDLAW